MDNPLHILIIDDHQDIVENLERKFQAEFNTTSTKTFTNCDDGFWYIKETKINNPIDLLVLDLSFHNNPKNSTLKDGFDLLDTLKTQSISIKTIIYTSHDTIYHIHPIMERFSPQGYVIKTFNSNQTLLHAAKLILNNGTYYDSQVIEARFTRIGSDKKLDSIDKAILDHLPSVKDITLDWEGVIIKKDGLPMSYNSIKIRLDKMLDKFEVETQAQLLLKLQKMGLLR